MVDRYADPAGGTGAGTQGDPWSLTHAAANLANNDRLILLSGTYTQRFAPVAQECNVISFTDNPDDVIIQGSVLNDSILDLNGLTGWTVESISVKFPSLTASGVDVQDIEISGGTGHTLNNIKIIGPTKTPAELKALNGGATNSRESGIGLLNNCSDITIDGVEIHYLPLHGILGHKPTPRLTIKNSNLDYVGMDSFRFGPGVDGSQPNQGVLVENCILGFSGESDCFQAAGTGTNFGTLRNRGIIFRLCLLHFAGENAFDRKDLEHILIDRCMVVGNWGMNNGDENTIRPWLTRGTGNVCEHAIIRNTVAFDNAIGSARLFEWDRMYNCTLINNRRTFNGSNQATVYEKTANAWIDGVASNRAKIKNTISGDHTAVAGIVQEQNPGADGGFDYNIYYNNNGAISFHAKNNVRKTFADWKTYLATVGFADGTDQNSRVDLTHTDLFENVPANPVETPDNYDFRIRTGSPALTGGGPLTTASNAGSVSTALIVADPYWFQDGWGRGVTDADEIIIGNQAAVKITAVDYATGAITLESARTWSINDPVDINGLKNKQGAYDFYGSTASTTPQTGILTVTKYTTAVQNYDLTAEGGLDWIAWGRVDVDTVDRKDGVTASISDWSQVGTFTSGRDLDGSGITFSWTDGTPVASVSGNNSTVRTQNHDAGEGFRITCPAGLSKRTLRFWVSGFNSTGRLIASLSDSAAPQIVNDTTNASTYRRYFDIEFRAGADGETLTVDWVDTADIGGTVNVMAAALKSPDYLIEHLFTAANGTLLSATTPDIDQVGGGLTVFGTPEIQTNQLRPAAYEDGFAINAGQQNQIVEYTFTAGGVDERVSLYACRDAASATPQNGFELNFRPAVDQAYCYKKLNGIITTLATITAQGYTSGGTYTLKIIRNGASVEFYVDATLLHTYVDDGSFPVKTHAGVTHYKWVDGSSRGDNFRVSSPPSMTDTTAPVITGTPIATPVGSDAIRIDNVVSASDAESGFSHWVLRNIGANKTFSTLPYFVEGLNPNTLYSGMTLAAVDNAGNESAQTAAFQATTYPAPYASPSANILGFGIGFNWGFQ